MKQVQDLFAAGLMSCIQFFLLWYMVCGGSGDPLRLYLTGKENGKNSRRPALISGFAVPQWLITIFFILMGILVRTMRVFGENGSGGSGLYYNLGSSFFLHYFALYLWLHLNRRISFYYAVIFEIPADICDLIVFVVLLRVFDIDVSSGDLSMQVSCLYVLLTFALQFLVVTGMKHFLEADKNRSLSYTQIFLIVLAIIPYLYMRDLGYWLPLANDDIGTSSLMALGITALIALILIIGNEKLVYFHIQQNELLKLHQMIDRQHEQYEMRKEAVDLVNQKYHDMRHELVAIMGMDQVDEIHSYVQSLRQEIQPFENFFRSGNPMLDVILTDKMEECRRKEIQLVPTVEAHALDFMDAADLCTIFGNALDNAIESCEKIQGETGKRITLKVRTVQGFLAVHVENPCQYPPRLSGGKFLTTKLDAENHGYGLEGIRHTVEKYQGEMEAGLNNGMFVLTLLIPLL